MSRSIPIVFAWAGFLGFSIAEVDLSIVDDWMACPKTPEGLVMSIERLGCSVDEFKDALFTYVAQPEWDVKHGDHGLHREIALISFETIGTTNDLPQILPFVLDDARRVHNGAVRAYVEISAKFDPDRMFEFADYVLQLPLPKEDVSRHSYVLTCFRWLLDRPTTSPEVRNAILDYFRRTRLRDQFCAYETDWYFAKKWPEYAGSEERRNLASIWSASSNALPGIKCYFVGVQRQYFPEDVSPDGEAPPPAQTNEQGTVRELVAAMPNVSVGDVADGMIASVDSTAGAESLQTSNSKSWFALLGILLVFGLVVGLRGRQSSGRSK